MFWRRRGRDRAEARPDVPTAPVAEETQPSHPVTEDAGAEPTDAAEPDAPEAVADGPIELERDAPRPVAIQHAAEALSRRGDRVIELFKEVASPEGRVNLAIHLKRGTEPEEDVVVEVATGPWDDEAVRKAARTASILRGSDHPDATLEWLSAYPLPDEVRFFAEKSPAATFGADLVQGDNLQDPEACAEAFRAAANRRWELDLGYEVGELSRLEELLTASLSEEAEGGLTRRRAPLVHGLGCYVGETLRRRSPQAGSWSRAEEWGEGIVLEFPDLTADPIGQAKSFLENGPEDSFSFYADYVIRELGGREGQA